LSSSPTQKSSKDHSQTPNFDDFFSDLMPDSPKKSSSARSKPESKKPAPKKKITTAPTSNRLSTKSVKPEKNSEVRAAQVDADEDFDFDFDF
jgi:hypothetical protein